MYVSSVYIYIHMYIYICIIVCVYIHTHALKGVGDGSGLVLQLSHPSYPVRGLSLSLAWPRETAQVQGHLKAGAKKVIFSAPAKDARELLVALCEGGGIRCPLCVCVSLSLSLASRSIRVYVSTYIHVCIYIYIYEVLGGVPYVLDPRFIRFHHQKHCFVLLL